MITKSLRNTILINIGAFLSVLILELLSGLLTIDRFDTNYLFYLWGLSYAVIIMAVIWINHFILIPFVYDKRNYFLYGILLTGSIFVVAYLKGYEANGWLGVSKFFFYLVYTTGTAALTEHKI